MDKPVDFSPFLQDHKFVALHSADAAAQQHEQDSIIRSRTLYYKRMVESADRNARARQALSDKIQKRKLTAPVDNTTRVKLVQEASAAAKQKLVPLGEQIDAPDTDDVCSGITAHNERCIETRSLKSVPGLVHPYNPDRELKLCAIRHFKDAENQKKKILACLKAYDEYEQTLLNANLDAMEGAGQAIINSVNARATIPKAPVAPKVQQRTGVALSSATKKPVTTAPAKTTVKPPAKPAPKPPPPRVAAVPKLTLDAPAPAPKVQAPLIDNSDADDGDSDDDDDDEDEAPPAVVRTESNDLVQKVNNLNL